MHETNEEVLFQVVTITDIEDDFYNREGYITGSEPIEDIEHFRVEFDNDQERLYTWNDFKFKYPEEVNI